MSQRDKWILVLKRIVKRLRGRNEKSLNQWADRCRTMVRGNEGRTAAIGNSLETKECTWEEFLKNKCRGQRLQTPEMQWKKKIENKGTDILATLFLKIFPDLLSTSLTHHTEWTILLSVNRTSRLTNTTRGPQGRMEN